jgi:hypothetical protein
MASVRRRSFWPQPRGGFDEGLHLSGLVSAQRRCRWPEILLTKRFTGDGWLPPSGPARREACSAHPWPHP